MDSRELLLAPSSQISVNGTHQWYDEFDSLIAYQRISHLLWYKPYFDFSISPAHNNEIPLGSFFTSTKNSSKIIQKLNFGNKITYWSNPSIRAHTVHTHLHTTTMIWSDPALLWQGNVMSSVCVDTSLRFLRSYCHPASFTGSTLFLLVTIESC